MNQHSIALTEHLEEIAVLKFRVDTFGNRLDVVVGARTMGAKSMRLDRLSSVNASLSIVTLPSGSAVVPRTIATLIGSAL